VNYEISLSADRTYVLIKVRGEMGREGAWQFIPPAHALGLQLDVHAYLVDLTESHNTDSVVQTFEFAYTDTPQHSDFDQRARVALLTAPDDHSHDFAETVMRNTGVIIALFRDLDSALRYLKEGG